MEIERWAHLDIAGVMESHGELPFLNKGMTGKLVHHLDPRGPRQ